MKQRRVGLSSYTLLTQRSGKSSKEPMIRKIGQSLYTNCWPPLENDFASLLKSCQLGTPDLTIH
jgi:hypothetical protein